MVLCVGTLLYNMGRRKGTSADNLTEDREKSWKRVFKGLVDLMQDQQPQLESLVKERKFLEKRIQLQHDKWVSDVKLFEDQISQLKRDSKIKEITRLVEVAKANLIIGMKQKEAIMYKLKSEDIDDERGDLKVLFDELFQCLAEPKSSNKNADVSVLKAERDFAWNQFKKTDSKLQEHVKWTTSEVQAASDKVQKLSSDLEQSESSNMEKDKMILALKDDIAKLEADLRKKSEEISHLTTQMELLRNSRSDSVTPVLRRCAVESGPSYLCVRNNRSNGMSITTKKDLHHLQIVEKILNIF